MKVVTYSEDLFVSLVLFFFRGKNHWTHCKTHVAGSDQVNIVMAVTLAVVNYLILKTVGRLEEVLPPPQPPPNPSLNGHKRRRRRRRRRNSSELSSDISDEEEVGNVFCYSTMQF